MEAAPWVRPETVEAAFREERSKGTKSKNREIGEKNLKLFRFVVERSDPIGRLKDGKPPNLRGISSPQQLTTEELIEDLRYEKLPTGRELVEEWNQSEWVEQNPSWAYSPEHSNNFLRDYRRTQTAVAYMVSPHS